MPARRLSLQRGRRGAGAAPRSMDGRRAPQYPRGFGHALRAARHAGRPGLRLRFPRGHRADRRAGDSLRRYTGVIFLSSARQILIRSLPACALMCRRSVYGLSFEEAAVMGGRWRTGARALCGRTAVAVLAATIGCVGFLLAPSPAQAQAVTGTLLGNVTDSSGAGVPGATVTALETQTNTSRTAVTNEAGYYIFSSLQNGTYTVDAELQGFKKVVRPERQGRRQHDRPRRSEAGSRPDQRDGDRRRPRRRCSRPTGPTPAASSSRRWCRSCRSPSTATSSR